MALAPITRGFVPDAGIGTDAGTPAGLGDDVPDRQRGESDRVDEESDQSFPASDAPSGSGLSL